MNEEEKKLWKRLISAERKIGFAIGILEGLTVVLHGSFLQRALSALEELRKEDKE